MSAPVIGLSTYRQQAAWGAWNTSADLLPTDYAASVQRAGGVPVLLPPVVGQSDAAARVVDRLDALVISGGADVEPSRYGADPHAATLGCSPDRDEWELALLDEAARVDLPVLGICRGMQLMAVHAGGVLDQHTPDLVGHQDHSPGGNTYGAIAIATVPGSRIATLVGAALKVNCHHHQSVRTHPGYDASAHAHDGTLEAIERDGARFAVGVQWHPETSVEVGLMRGLVAAAQARLTNDRP